jgi:hypothetical protein
MINYNANSLSERKGEPRRGWLARFGLGIVLSLGMTIAFQKNDSVALKPKTTHFKQYAFIKLNNDFKEFYCLDELWFRESRWDYKAKNKRSSAYGIPQLLGLKETNPFKQIDKGLKYIEHRYDKPCHALAFHNRKGWY